MFASMRIFLSQEDESGKWISTLTRLFCLLFVLTPLANAETIAKAGRFGGITIRYKVVFPNAYGILGTDTEFLYFRNSVSVPRIPSDPEFQKFNRAPTVNLRLPTAGP